jgi:predicted ATPase
VAIGGSALPWGDRFAFAELMLAWEMRSYHIAEDQPGHVFFDRGVPDVVGYLRLSGLPVPRYTEAAAKRFRYNRRVFIAPPWLEIFGQDSERKQTFDEAVRTHAAMVATYRDFGYALVEIPLGTVEERVRFVVDTITEVEPYFASPGGAT